jgi:DNA-binding response OmpR family regulator
MSAEKILIIDDDEDLCELLAESLADEGISATYTHDPMQGIRLIENGAYDMLLLDYKMPGLNGTEIVRKIKTANIKMNILIISGRPFLEKILADEGLTGMVNGILTKPIDFERLLHKIRQ